RALATLLGGQLLAQQQLIQATAQRQEGECLTVLYPRREQAAEWQRQGGFDTQPAAGQRCVEQGDHQPIEALLYGLACFDPALQLGTCRQLLRIDAAQQGLVAGLQRQGQSQPGFRECRDDQLDALRQRARTAGFQGSLAAIVHGQPEQQLKALRGLPGGQDFGFGRFARSQQALQWL